jgi:hypothetical protein
MAIELTYEGVTLLGLENQLENTSTLAVKRRSGFSRCLLHSPLNHLLRLGRNIAVSVFVFCDRLQFGLFPFVSGIA